SWQAQAPQMPWRHEYGASRAASMSTSSIRVPGAHGSRVVAPSSVTDRVATGAPSRTTAVASNGLSASDRNRSTCTRDPGTPSRPGASRARARNGAGPQMNASAEPYGPASAASAASAAADGTP